MIAICPLLFICLQKRIGLSRRSKRNKQNKRHILFGDFVQPICLPASDKITTEGYNHKQGCKFSGWTGGKSGEHYLVGHAAEINKGYACKHNGDNLSTSNKNCLLVRSLSPPKSPTDNADNKRKPVNIKEKERSHENGMPLVCLNSTAHSSPHSQKYNQQSAEHALDQYELSRTHNSISSNLS